MGTTGALRIFCLDQSEAAFGSEDFPGSRWRYQAGIVEALAERLYFQHGAQADTAHLSAAHSLPGAQHSLCMLSGSSAKLLSPPAPLTERAAVLSRLHGLQPCCGASSNLAFALKLAALVAGSSRSASITAFVAGQCSISESDLPGLVGVLGRHQVTIISLASPAELGTHAVGALQRLTASLNDPSPGKTYTELGRSDDSLQGIPKDRNQSGAGYRLVFLEPPEETLEPWQQLERALEALEHPDKQQVSDTCAASHSAAATSADAAELGGGDVGQTSSSAGVGHGEAAGLAVASRQRSSRRSTRQRAGSAQAYDVNRLWHRNRALLARRSGVYASAACRGESLDALGHLSSDGCMRPWLPSYANLPRAVGSLGPSPLHELYLQRLLPQPKWTVLMEIPGGIMRKASLRASTSRARSASLDDAPCSSVGEQSAAAVKPPAELHVTSRSSLQSKAAVPVPPPELQLEGTPVPSSDMPRREPGSASLTTAPGWELSRAAASLTTAPSREQGRAARIGSRRRSGQSSGRPLKSCTGRRPLRLEADARSGRIMLVQSMDSRRLLRIIWCPTAGDASTNAALHSRSMRQRQSIWEPSSTPAEGCSPKAKLLNLPEHELKFTLEPAAVSFSAIHSDQVLLVEQKALTADGRPSQSSNKGLFRHLSAEGGQVERCFFWLQGSIPATTLREGIAADMYLPASAAEAARQLHCLVQSSATKASSEAQSCAVLPLLQLSGSLQLSFQPLTGSAEPIATEPGSKALTVQHQGRPAPSMGALLSGSLHLTIGQQAISASEHERAQHASTCMDLAAGHQKHLLASRAASCTERRPDTVSMDSREGCSLAGEVDLVVAAASAETGTEAGQDCFEDIALYELD